MKVKVLQIISGFAVEGPLGGIERFVIELSRSFDPLAIECTVCGMWDYETPYEDLHLQALKNQQIAAFIGAPWNEQSPLRAYLNCLKRTRARLKGQRFDIIHSHCQFGDMLALQLHRSLGRPVLVRTVHNEKEWGKRPMRRLLLTNLIFPLFYKGELGVAQQVVENLDSRPLARVMGVKSYMMPNALNIARFNNPPANGAELKRQLHIPPDSTVIGSIGRFVPQKGFDLLLESFRLLQKELPKTHLLIIGEGPDLSHLKQTVKAQGLENKVTLPGARTDIEALLAVMDLFVSSSRWEGLPTVIMEAMTAGIPVVGFKVGGNEELIIDGETGFLVSDLRPAALARQIVHMITLEESEKGRLQKTARDHIAERFSISGVAHHHEQLYQRLLIN